MPVIEFEVKRETKAMRSDIGFEAFYRFFKDDFKNASVEEILFRSMYTKTFYYDGGWLSDYIDGAKTEYLNDPVEFLDLLLECDPEFKLWDHFDNEDEFIISIVGVFIEQEIAEGDWENGYYTDLLLFPKIAGYEIVKKEHKKEIYSMGEDNYE